MNSIISIKDVSFAYDDIEVLKNVNLEVQPGEFIAVLGHNGGGKSTLVKLMNGLILPATGTVTIDGAVTNGKDTIWQIRSTCGMVFQNPDNQLIATSVEEDVAFGLENIGVPREEMDERIDDALGAVSMSEFRKNQPHMLSGGQKQRIAIAGILAMRPRVILLDEATAMLDPKGTREVMDILTKLNKEMGITIIHVTHHMDEALCASRAVVMSGGEIIMDDTPVKVFMDDRIEELRLDMPPIIKVAKELGIKIDGEFSKEEVLFNICRL